MSYSLHSAQVIWGKDLAEDSPVPWYLPLDGGQFSITNFRATAIGRCVTKYMVNGIKCIKTVVFTVFFWMFLLPLHYILTMELTSC